VRLRKPQKSLFLIFVCMSTKPVLAKVILWTTMSRKPAHPKATGGGGFTFADKVAAFFTAKMLGRELPLGLNIRPIVEIHFETRGSGWLLDDLPLSFPHHDHLVRCALSVKSNIQLTEAGFPSDFVKDVWEQWRGVPGDRIDLGLQAFSPSRETRRSLLL
jgi:hypothetical protein